MVGVRVDRPVGEDHIGALGFQKVTELPVLNLIQLSVPIHLVGKHELGSQNPTGPLRFRATDGCCFSRGLTRDTKLAAGQEQSHDFVTKIRAAGHRPATTRLRVIRVPTNAYDSQILTRRVQPFSLIPPGLTIRVGTGYCCSISLTSARVTVPAISGPTELISPYQRSGLFCSQGGSSSHSALGIM